VLEVDVVPQSVYVAEEAFFVKSKENKKHVLYLFTESRILPQCVSDERSVAFMSKHKNLITDTRKYQENQPKTTAIRPNLRQKMLDLMCAGISLLMKH
jgi:predicted metal-dependent hydrolase